MAILRNPILEAARLGPLEMQVLAAVCRRGDATVRELLAEGMDAAYTTVMTTLDRLYKKNLLERELDVSRRAFRYRVKLSEPELYRTVLGSDLSRILQSSRDPALPVSFLVDAVAEHDSDLLEELQRAVDRKRRELRRRRKP
jgi:predicted transcriptional regulator